MIFKFEGNRALVLPIDAPIPTKELTLCLSMALRYHLEKT